MYNFCDRCQQPQRNQITTVVVQSGELVRLSDGQERLKPQGVQQMIVLCDPCSRFVADGIRTLVEPPVRQQQPHQQAV